jgi:hypothetical protein
MTSSIYRLRLCLKNVVVVVFFVVSASSVNLLPSIPPVCGHDYVKVIKMADSSATSESSGLFANLFLEIIKSPVNIALVGVITLLVYKIVKSRQRIPEPAPAPPALPKLRKDFTVEELRQYDGTGPDGRILVAVNGKVFDVTKGRRFYGPGIINRSHETLSIFYVECVQEVVPYDLCVLHSVGH